MAQNKKLEELTRLVQHLVDNPVLPVKEVAPVAPVLPIVPTNSNDHDLLQRLDEKVDSIILQIDKLSDGTANKIDDHEKRLKELEKCTVNESTYNTKHDELIKKFDTLNGKIIWIFAFSAGVAFIASIVLKFLKI